MSLGEPRSATQRQTESHGTRDRLLYIGGMLLVAAIATAVLVVAVDSRAWIISAAFGDNGKGDSNVVSLAASLGKLSDDALGVMAPVASLGGIVGGIMWALGSQRGQGLVTGSVVGGVMAVSITTILN